MSANCFRAIFRPTFAATELRPCGQHQRASATLQFIFSSTAGVMFVMLLADLAGYLRASSAAHEALVTTMRCIAPTEAGCIDSDALAQTTLTTTNLEADWFGFQNTPPVPVAALQQVSYSPTVQQFAWQNTFNVFSVPDNNLTANWPVQEIPVRRFVTRLNSWFDTWAPVNRVFELRETLPDGQVVVLETLKDQQQGMMMYLPHGIEHGPHFVSANSDSNAAVDAFTSESWCIPGAHSPGLEDANSNSIPDQLDQRLATEEGAGGGSRNLEIVSYCQLEHDDLTWVRQANCDWEGRDPVDPRYGTEQSPYYNQASQPLSTLANINGLQQPGSSQEWRPQAVADSAQYLVIEVAGCADGLLAQLNSSLTDLSAITSNFDNSPTGEAFTSSWRESLVSEGHLPEGSETFYPSGNILTDGQGANTGLLAQANWTYLSLTQGENQHNRKLCSPWRELTPALASDPVFSDIFDEEFRGEVTAGTRFLSPPEPVLVTETNLICATDSEQLNTFQCQDSSAGCGNSRVKEACFQEIRAVSESDPAISLEARNSPEQTGLSETFWENYGESILPTGSETNSIPQSLASLNFEFSTTNEKREALSPLGCSGLEPLREITIALADENNTSCSAEALNNNPPRAEDWQRAALDQLPAVVLDLESVNLNPFIAPLDTTLSLNDTRNLPAGLNGTWFGNRSSFSERESCGDAPTCNQPGLSEAEAVEQAIVSQHGERFSGCKVVDPGRQIGAFTFVQIQESLNPCLPKSVNCQYPEHLPGAVADHIVTGRAMPESCTGPEAKYRGCYAVATSQPPSVAPPEDFLLAGDPDSLINFQLAREIGFSQLRRSERFSELSETECGTTPGCTSIEVDIDQDMMVQGYLAYNMPVGPVLATIIGNNSIQIIQTKSEMFGLARTGRGMDFEGLSRQ